MNDHILDAVAKATPGSGLLLSEAALRTAVATIASSVFDTESKLFSSFFNPLLSNEYILQLERPRYPKPAEIWASFITDRKSGIPPITAETQRQMINGSNSPGFFIGQYGDELRGVECTCETLAEQNQGFDCHILPYWLQLLPSLRAFPNDSDATQIRLDDPVWEFALWCKWPGLWPSYFPLELLTMDDFFYKYIAMYDTWPGQGRGNATDMFADGVWYRNITQAAVNVSQTSRAEPVRPLNSSSRDEFLGNDGVAFRVLNEPRTIELSGRVKTVRLGLNQTVAQDGTPGGTGRMFNYSTIYNYKMAGHESGAILSDTISTEQDYMNSSRVGSFWESSRPTLWELLWSYTKFYKRTTVRKHDRTL